MVKLEADRIETWVANHFQYKRRKNGAELRICNPDGDTRYNLRISTEYRALKKRKTEDGKPIYGYWVHDYRVNHQQYDGSLINFIKKYKGITYFEALSELTGQSPKQLRDVLRKNRRTEVQIEHIEEKSIDVKLPSCIPFSEKKESKAREITLNYLINRGVSEKSAIEHLIHYTPTSLIFPYIEYGEVVYWQLREVLDKRFEFPDQMKTGLAKTDYLYNFDNVEQPSDYVIVVESIFNCLSIGDNCVATSGAVIPDEAKQVIKLRLLDPKVVILAPDNDAAGIKSLKHNFYALKSHFKLAYSIPPGDADWNDMDVQDGIGSAKRFIENNTKWLSVVSLCRLLERPMAF